MGFGDRLTRLVTVSFALGAASTGAHAQQPPPQPAAPPEQAGAIDESQEIVVLAEPSDSVRIDRRTYTLRDDAVAQSTDMFEVLGRVPSVSVSPEGSVSLLGASNVIIQINSQPVPGNSLEQILRGLQGAQVERIEVISNPSAQFSAQASGGIINIVTRQRHDAGASGSASVGVNSAQGYLINVGPSWTRGPWFLSLWAGVNHNASDRDYRRIRRDLTSGLRTADIGEIDRVSDSGYGWLQLGYKPNNRNTFTISANGADGSPDIRQPITRRDSINPPIDRLTETDSGFRYRAASFDYLHVGDQAREQLKFNLAIDQNGNDNHQTISQTESGGLSRFATRSDSDSNTVTSKLDYETPTGEYGFLSVGAMLDSRRYDVDNSLQTLIGTPGVIDYTTGLNARDQTLAAYGTYQVGVGDWTILPGLRIENYRREVAGSGAESDDTDVRAFPTMHLRRALSDEIDLDLSYSSRIHHPELRDLDPTLRFIDATRATSGNPHLRPTTTDAFEASLSWQSEGRTFSITAFDRSSEDITSPFTQQIGAVTLYTQVNAGESTERGLQAIWRGPLGQHWRYSLSASALSNERDTLNGAATERQRDVEYSGNVQIEYRDPDQSRVGANNFALDVRFNGPTHDLQGETEANTQTNLTWRRRLTPKAFAVIILQDVFSSQDSISIVRANDFSERTETLSQGVRLRVALTYQWGAGSDRMQDRGAPNSGAPSQ